MCCYSQTVILVILKHYCLVIHADVIDTLGLMIVHIVQRLSIESLLISHLGRKTLDSIAQEFL